MPIYEYKCATGHFYKEERSIKEEQRLKICPKCGHDLKPAYGPIMFNLVGKGFYSNGG